MYTLWHLDGRVKYPNPRTKFYEMPGGPYKTRGAAVFAAGKFIRQGQLISYAITEVGKPPWDTPSRPV